MQPLSALQQSLVCHDVPKSRNNTCGAPSEARDVRNVAVPFLNEEPPEPGARPWSMDDEPFSRTFHGATPLDFDVPGPTFCFRGHFFRGHLTPPLNGPRGVLVRPAALESSKHLCCHASSTPGLNHDHDPSMRMDRPILQKPWLKVR